MERSSKTPEMELQGGKEFSNVFFHHIHRQPIHHDFSAFLLVVRLSTPTRAATATVASAPTVSG